MPDSKEVKIASHITLTISEFADLPDLIFAITETISLQNRGYVLQDNPFQVFYGKTLEFTGGVEGLGAPNTILELPVEELKISVRTYNCLKNANIQTIGGIVHKTERELLQTKNFGRKSINELKEALATMDLSLRPML